MNKQKGVSLSGLLIWCFILGIVALFTMRIAPSAIEYFKIVKAVKTIAGSAGAEATVQDLRKAYERQMSIDSIDDVGPEMLEFSKEGKRIVISFSYEKRLPLFGPVSLVIAYQGSSGGS